MAAVTSSSASRLAGASQATRRVRTDRPAAPVPRRTPRCRAEQSHARLVAGSSANTSAQSGIERVAVTGAACAAVLLGAAPAHAAGAPATPPSAVANPISDEAFLDSQAAQALEHFFTGGVGGCVGAAVVFPIDLVKTRLQAQKGDEDDSEGGEPKYSGGIDCFATVLREEGALALYSGLSAQLIGVWPEKAVKLTANDFMRGVLASSVTGALPLHAQVAAGAFGGLCQTVFTNPLEIVKIQLQLQGTRKVKVEVQEAPQPVPVEAGMAFQAMPMVPAMASVDSSFEEDWGSEVALKTTSGKTGLVEVVKDLGFAGLYRGTAICAARDVLFSGIYFPLFATLKEVLATQGHQGGLWLLMAGTLSGIPAAYLSTPIDMIKTRVQANSNGSAATPSAMECTREIIAEGGWQALFTGGVARVARSAPQFGVTLLVYDQLNSMLQAYLQQL